MKLKFLVDLQIKIAYLWRRKVKARRREEAKKRLEEKKAAQRKSLE
jgi:hypothetical protein